MTPLAILLAIALAVVQFHQHTPPVVAVKPAAEDAVAIQYIQTDPHIAERLAVKTSRTTWQIIGDNELLAGIAQAGDAGGIAQVNGQPTLVLVDSTR